MTLQFNEIAPGVHTSSLMHPKTKCSRSIAVIASSNGWQLFIENELTARNLPSFEVAAARAELAIGPQRSLTMVRVAIVLVALAIVGGSAIGVAKLIPGELTVIADQMRPAPAPAIVNAKSLVVTTVSDGRTVPLPEMQQPDVKPWRR
ncbi:MAG: hypothetical protein ACR2O1_13685 [Boseongicola sp.]